MPTLKPEAVSTRHGERNKQTPAPAEEIEAPNLFRPDGDGVECPIRDVAFKA
jgi:hypothetical protein